MEELDKKLLGLAEKVRARTGLHIALIPDGKFHRHAASGKGPDNKAGYSLTFQDANGCIVGDFITGDKETFFVDGYQPSEEEVDANKRVQLELDVQKTSEQYSAAEKAGYLLIDAEPARADHPYLATKNIVAAGLKQIGDTLLVPIRDTQGLTWNIQKIMADGQKRYMRGALTKGVFAVVGEINKSNPIYVAEGYATASTVATETGGCCVAAMSAGNLKSVCIALRNHLPDSTKIIVAADNDHLTEGNPGLTQARTAAEAIHAQMIIPPLPCSNPECECTDFNDLINCKQRV